MSIEQIVEDLLYEKQNCRDDNDILYWNVCKRINPDMLYNQFGNVIMHRKEYGMPSYDTVTRARRLIMANNPELKASAEVEAYRIDMEGRLREFYRR